MQEEDIRFIENPFLKIVNIIQPQRDKLYQLLFNLIQEFLKASKMPTLEAVASNPKQNRVDLSAYGGVGGYAYTFIRLSRFLASASCNESEKQLIMRLSINAQDQQASKLQNSDYYLKLAHQQYKLERSYYDQRRKKSKKRKSVAFYMSETCTYLCGMHLAYMMNNVMLFRDNQQKLMECFELYQSEKQSMMWQVLYGAPGFLYCFLELQQHYDNHRNPNYQTKFSRISIEITQDIINSGIHTYEQTHKIKIDPNQLPDDFRLTYLFHNKQYLGGAHGLGGNLNLLMLAFKLNNFHGQMELYCRLLSKSISFLLRHLRNGNFATSAGGKRIKLVHFCHGAPGIVSGLARFANMFPEEGIKLGLKEVITQNLDHIWQYGVLKKGYGLCHGITGNAYAFIAPSIQEMFIDRREELLKQAMLFGLLREQKVVINEIRNYAFSDRFVKGISDNPYSLMLGIAGDICFTIDVIVGVGQFPGFDF